MADFDETYPLTEELKAHWNSLREQRGWDWATLADCLERYSAGDPTTPALAEWARSQTGAKRTAKKGTERATKTAPEKR